MQNDYSDLKNIISTFIKQPVSAIENETVIDKTIVQGSILIHRMYAEITDIGFEIENYNEIKTFSDLLNKINPDNISSVENTIVRPPLNDIELPNNNSIGIDIEKVTNFNKVADYREDNFYKQNFSEKEISYCLLQPNILQSFAGKFAAKEAIVKANNSYINIPFNKIEIIYNDKGKPFFQNIQISISHSDNIAIAVAILIKNNDNKSILTDSNKITPNNNQIFKTISIISILIAVFSLIYSIFV